MLITAYYVPHCLLYVKLGDNIVSGPLMHDLFVPMYNLTRKLLDRMSIFLAVNEKIVRFSWEGG